MSVFKETRDKLYSQYIEIVEFLRSQYGEITPWLCKRTIMALVADQVFILRNAAGEITACAGWWLIPPEAVAVMEDGSYQAETATEGNLVWVMDMASTDRHGVRKFQSYLRKRYPVSSGVQGIAWLRNGARLVVSQRQQGVKNEMVF